MYKIPMLALMLWSLLAVSAQAEVQVCADGRVLALTPFNRNPCGGASQAPPPSNPAPAPSSNAIVCEDGRKVQRTPFNPNPCRVVPPAAPARIPDEFLALFGGTPPALGLAIEDRVAEQVYQARYQRFVAQMREPAAFAAVGARYFAAGLGEPGFYQARSGPRVRWAAAPFHPADAALADALDAPQAVIAAWQAQAILRGGVVQAPSAALPPAVRAIHQERLEGIDGATASSPTVLVWESSEAALGLHEDGVELAGPAGVTGGVLTQPARPGELIRLFLAGLGDVKTLEVSLGGVTLLPEDYAFSRIASNRGGLWGLALRLPASVSAGDVPVKVVADGVSSGAGPYLTVSR